MYGMNQTGTVGGGVCNKHPNLEAKEKEEKSVKTEGAQPQAQRILQR
jgi:hypothetical protein